MYKVGTSTYGFDINDENFKSLSQSGIAAVEVAIPFEKVELLDYKKAFELSKKYDIKLWSSHLPFHTTEVLDVASTDENIRKKSVDFLKEHIKKATDVGIDKLVIHPSSEPVSEICDIRKKQLESSMKSLNTLAETAGENGAVIAVEDLPRSCLGRNSDELLTLLSANNKLRVCFDTNHLLSQDSSSFINAVADKIVTVHISDYDFKDERHWLPGKGKIDWKNMVSDFAKAKYDGVWLYEVALDKSKNVNRKSDVSFKDLFDNAKMLFSL